MDLRGHERPHACGTLDPTIGFENVCGGSLDEPSAPRLRVADGKRVGSWMAHVSLHWSITTDLAQGSATGM